jgi:hypothetical protein
MKNITTIPGKKRYIKKPIPVSAVVWTGENHTDLITWSKGTIMVDLLNGCYIQTLEGVMRPNIGDYVVKGHGGEFWFVKKHIFEETYEELK